MLVRDETNNVIQTIFFCVLLIIGIITEVDGEGNAKDPLVGKEAIPMETTKPLDQWEFNRAAVEEIESLGHGKMGRVFKGYGIGLKPEEKRTLIAVKEFEAGDKDHKDEFHLEVEMLAQLKHVNVVKLLGVSTTVSPWYLITDFGDEVCSLPCTLHLLLKKSFLKCLKIVSNY